MVSKDPVDGVIGEQHDPVCCSLVDGMQERCTNFRDEVRRFNGDVVGQQDRFDGSARENADLEKLQVCDIALNLFVSRNVAVEFAIIPANRHGVLPELLPSLADQPIEKIDRRSGNEDLTEVTFQGRQNVELGRNGGRVGVENYASCMQGVGGAYGAVAFVSQAIASIDVVTERPDVARKAEDIAAKHARHEFEGEE